MIRLPGSGRRGHTDATQWGFLSCFGDDVSGTQTAREDYGLVFITLSLSDATVTLRTTKSC